jgi:hypothetical protein
VNFPRESSCKTLGQRSVSGFSAAQCFAMEDAGTGFLASRECRADLNGLRTESQRGDNAP